MSSIPDVIVKGTDGVNGTTGANAPNVIPPVSPNGNDGHKPWREDYVPAQNGIPGVNAVDGNSGGNATNGQPAGYLVLKAMTLSLSTPLIVQNLGGNGGQGGQGGNGADGGIGGNAGHNNPNYYSGTPAMGGPGGNGSDGGRAGISGDGANGGDLLVQYQNANLSNPVNASSTGGGAGNGGKGSSAGMGGGGGRNETGAAKPFAPWGNNGTGHAGDHGSPGKGSSNVVVQQITSFK
jgi:hypothetical protein